jgi:hypothetical protein
LSKPFSGDNSTLAKNNGEDNKVAKGAASDTVWPAVLIGLALVINLTWIGALACEIYRLF